ncbi:uncharacterized protein ARMOST_04623 [Armillaria ostoyae]|uniref:Uncharacterized protein n=1 Tax=Armillaria ostoyae TaxID=47428 RepID=A0A284QXU0_ARMOS|nr:uncharacterized protein ARMOST_04623 [Armillaria ostoyae]
MPHTDPDNNSIPPLESYKDNDNNNAGPTNNPENNDSCDDMETSTPEGDTSETTKEAHLEKLVKLWKAPVYVFFSPVLNIAYDDNSHVYYAFHCLNCSHKISCYPDMADAGLTGALWHHIWKCWGDEVLAAADATKDLTKSHEVVDKELRKHKPKNGSIVSMLKWFGSKVISYSTHAHTKTEVR